MDFIACKFGGTSVATSEKIERIEYILSANSNRRCAVLSAPGKAFPTDIKVTDLLIDLCKKAYNNEECSELIEAVKKRYFDIYETLGVPSDKITQCLTILDRTIAQKELTIEEYRDAVVALGEDMNAQLFTEYLHTKGKNAVYVSPAKIGLIVTDQFGDALPTVEARKNLQELKKYCDEKIVIFPGFFGVTKDNKTATFSRGGSDFTGALLAEAIDAAEYENWTDVDGILSANPTMVEKPSQIPSLTYKEMRELSYMGFNVFHEEAVTPVMKKKIPIRLRNMNNLDNQGTLIVAERLASERDVVGIACHSSFTNFNLQKFLLNREVGFGRRFLQIFEDLGISYEHMPSGVDNISVIINQKHLTEENENIILNKIDEILQPDDIKVEKDITLLAVVGEGLLHKIGVLGQVAMSLSKVGVNIKIVNQGSSELSIIFGIDKKDELIALQALYKEFFK